MEGGHGLPLVCLHGAGGLRLSRGHELLTRERRLIAFEMPGFGDSPSWPLWLAVDAPSRVRALVLAAPAAIRREGSRPPEDSAQLAAALYHHPERRPAAPPAAPEVDAKQRTLVDRLIGPARDAELEAAMRSLAVPTLVMFGTEDRLTPPELGRHYPELLPHGHLVLVYDAAHALDADRARGVCRARLGLPRAPGAVRDPPRQRAAVPVVTQRTLRPRFRALSVGTNGTPNLSPS